MKICATCQRKYADSLQYCLEDGTVLSPLNDPQATLRFEAQPTQSPAEHSIAEEKSQRTIVIVVAVVAALLIGGLFYLLLRKTLAPTPPQSLTGAIRPGSPEWEKYSKLIARDEPEADEATRAIGDTVMTLHTTVRNFTGRTITGLEMSAAVLDHQDKAVKEQTVVIIPGQRNELEPNKTLYVPMTLEGFTDNDDRAKLKMEVTGFRLQ